MSESETRITPEGGCISIVSDFSEIAGSAPHLANRICLPRRTGDFGEIADNGAGVSVRDLQIKRSHAAMNPIRKPELLPVAGNTSAECEKLDL